MALNTLVLQYRSDDTVAVEQQNYIDALTELEFDLRDVKLVFHNMLRGPISDAELDKADKVIFGSSGDLHLSVDHKGEEWFDHSRRVIDKVGQSWRPHLGIGFGGRLMAENYGATLRRGRRAAMQGAYEILLTTAGMMDEILYGLKSGFLGLFDHQDFWVESGGDIKILANTERLDWAAYKVNNKEAWGVQFQPELSAHRAKRLLKNGSGTRGTNNAVTRYQEAPHQAQVLKHFMLL